MYDIENMRKSSFGHLAPRFCARCGNAFLPGSANSKYCGKTCREQAKRERERKSGRRKDAKRVDRYVVVNQRAADEIRLAREETRRRAGW